MNPLSSSVEPPCGLSDRVVLALPPDRFRAARNIWGASRTTCPIPPRSGPHKSGAQIAGLRYEKKVNAFLSGKFPHYESGVWFSFFDETGKRFCQIDGLLFFPTGVAIFETKIRHCADAWWQLKRLYSLVIASAYPNLPQLLIEITRSYDSAIVVPEDLDWISNLDDWMSSPRSSVGVFQWKP